MSDFRRQYVRDSPNRFSLVDLGHLAAALVRENRGAVRQVRKAAKSPDNRSREGPVPQQQEM